MGAERPRHAAAAITRFQSAQGRLTCYFCASIIEEDAVLRVERGRVPFPGRGSSDG